MGDAGLSSPFAWLYGPALADLDLAGPVMGIALQAGLLSAAYPEAAARLDEADPDAALWKAVALGRADAMEATDSRGAAVLAGLGGAPVPEAVMPLLDEGRVGEAALWAVAAFGQGLDGDRGAVTDALATLRALGFEDAARRAALEYLILGEDG